MTIEYIILSLLHTCSKPMKDTINNTNKLKEIVLKAREPVIGHLCVVKVKQVPLDSVQRWHK